MPKKPIIVEPKACGENQPSAGRIKTEKDRGAPAPTTLPPFQPLASEPVVVTSEAGEGDEKE